MKRRFARGVDTRPAPRRWAAAAILLVLIACTGTAPPLSSEDGRVARDAEAASSADSIVVAVRSVAEAVPSVGGTPRGAESGRYAGSDRAAAVAAELAREHGLVEQAVWTIVPLRWRCMVYRTSGPRERARVLAELQRDPRVELAQPLNEFRTYVDDHAAHGYSDPYVGLQRGFAAVDAAGAQRLTRGAGVRIALIDSEVDASHPDLEGRVEARRDFVPASATGRPAPPDPHGTQMAGVIAANADNRIGIVGMAPSARLLALRACWSRAGVAGATCDSLTLAQALAAAIEGGADVINLSLGGPADPLLARLALRAIAGGAIVVGAVPPSGRLEGFPSGVPGVVAVASSDEAVTPDAALAAPGRDILTLAPGGGYDYASGSSLAAAHVSGAIALLRALKPALGGPEAARLLGAGGHGPIDVCAAVRRWRPTAVCAAGRRPADRDGA